MKFKLDENASPAWRTPLHRQGHDVATVADESLQGAEDAVVGEACRREGRCLVTADLDFAQILDFPPERYVGLIVLRHPRPTIRGMLGLVEQVAVAVTKESPAGRLWIVEPGRLRIHGSTDDEP